ncbi:protoporphyrinogen oxidase [Streptomyces sp. N2-109]|uniref:Coproporphyrinogen III oxidase n=1 Tax=Streptomyces gossypii TaxID=2883101 RepID=A0ABT2JSH8_9ACTN|nr:protoporphyrinogen oxidase [Streptomyces gossypii]MCT2590847.1 protoporphyrinogen oxidase [Streptomyces gossypii]
MTAARRPGGATAVVIGGGISGLAAARRLLADGVSVTLLEASSRLGGKLRLGDIAGSAAVDLGAESVLARRPEAVDLARSVGLGDALQPPATTGAAVWTRGALRPMPTGHVMGVPADPAALGGVISPDGLARIAEDEQLPPTEIGEDVAVGAYVAARLGREVVDRLVEPLLGGVYAGDAYRLSMRAVVPQLYEAARAERSLLAGVRALLERRAAAEVADAGGAAAGGGTAGGAAAGGAAGGPVFLGIEGGIGRLPEATAAACRAAGGDLRTGTPVRALRRTTAGAVGTAGAGDHSTRTGWRVTLQSGEHLDADAVVLAVPAGIAARLLAAEAPSASAELGAVEYASMALVTMAFRRADLHTTPPGSGFLVPPVDGRTIKAATFSASKWAWTAAQDPELFVLRTSVGRHGEEDRLDRLDEDLVADSRHDLEAAAGITAKPVDTVVSRWQDGLPQYPVGHLERVARVRLDLASLPPLAVCGAAYDGVGIPACVGSGDRAAEETLARIA